MDRHLLEVENLKTYFFTKGGIVMKADQLNQELK